MEVNADPVSKSPIGVYEANTTYYCSGSFVLAKALGRYGTATSATVFVLLLLRLKVFTRMGLAQSQH